MNNEKKKTTRKWLGVITHCCGVYSRVYLNVRGVWTGYCARCARKITLQ